MCIGIIIWFHILIVCIRCYLFEIFQFFLLKKEKTDYVKKTSIVLEENHKVISFLCFREGTKPWNFTEHEKVYH